ncbi:MAG: FAD-dependent monooxygenase, partial [Promethearchaeota archaeon]
MKYDFIVIGSGIAGSFFADLASNYASVLVIDKMPRPRSEFRGGVFPAHNYSYFHEKDAPIPLDDKKIFSSDQYELLYSGREHDGMIDGHEFGGPFGKICELDKLDQFLIERAEKKGTRFIFESEVSSVSVKEDHVSVEINEKHSESALRRATYNADVLILATGAQIALSKEDILKNDPENLVLKAFNLQRSLGFSLPEIYFAAALKYKGSPEVIDENIPFQYRYHYNRKISPYGPLYCVKHKDYFDIGIIHKTPFNAIDRLIAVVKRYKKVRGFFKNTKPISYNFSIDISSLKLEESKKEEFPIVIIPTTKHAIKETTKDRVIVLGEAAGLVTDLFYEGVVGALASARFASDVLKDLKSQADLSKDKSILSYKNSINALK